MKIQPLNRLKEHGSVLLVAMGTCVVLFIFMAGYLYLIQSNSISVARSQNWNYAIAVAEAGVEEAMAHLNSGVDINNLGVNTWTNMGGSTYQKSQQLGTNGTGYLVTIIATNTANPVITSTGSVPGPITTPNLVRTVVVKCMSIAASVPPGAMVVSTTVDFMGMGINTDSFNSTNLALFPGGLYNSANAQDNGDVVTLSSASSVSIQNGKVKGTVRATSGTTSDLSQNISPGGSVGQKWWVDGNYQGVETNPDRFKADVSASFPDATLPDTGGKIWLTPPVVNYKTNGVTYKYVLTGSNPWKIDTLDGGVYVASGNVKLQVTGGFALKSGDEIRIDGPGDLSLYVSAPNASVGGNGIVNDTGLAGKFRYIGLPSNIALSFGANVAFTGVIYAPEADFTLGGGGKNTYDFIGQSITKSAKMNGHYNFHYDEGTPPPAGGSGYSAISWDEL